MYELPPFDPHFDPYKHNKYFLRRSKLEEERAAIKIIEDSLKEAQIEKEKTRDRLEAERKFRWHFHTHTPPK